MNPKNLSRRAYPITPLNHSPRLRWPFGLNGLWFLSLVISLTCALMATLLQQWARRYLEVAYPPLSPPKRARMRLLFRGRRNPACSLGRRSVANATPCFPFPVLRRPLRILVQRASHHLWGRDRLDRDLRHHICMSYLLTGYFQLFHVRWTFARLICNTCGRALAEPP